MVSDTRYYIYADYAYADYNLLLYIIYNYISSYCILILTPVSVWLHSSHSIPFNLIHICLLYLWFISLLSIKLYLFSCFFFLIIYIMFCFFLEYSIIIIFPIRHYDFIFWSNLVRIIIMLRDVYLRHIYSRPLYSIVICYILIYSIYQHESLPQ